MHRPLRLDPRWWRASVLVAAVVLGHALLLQFATRAPRDQGSRSAAIEVRRLLVIAPPAEPAVVETVGQAPKKSPPAARAPAPRAARTEPARAEAQPARAETPSAPAIQRPTRVPPSTDLVFALQRGAQTGEARLSWRADGERYALSLHATLPSGREVEQRSEGGFDAAGLAPLRLADRRGGRDVRAANFQREHGKVTFSGPRWELPLENGTQDRLSWLVQLVALIGGASEGLRDGTELAMWVVGARGSASHWRFEVRGRQRVEVDAQSIDAWWLVREPAHPYDLRVEVWLNPEQGHWPLKLRQTQIPGGEPLDWSLRLQPPPGRSEGS
jgi:hypothetical protein